MSADVGRVRNQLRRTIEAARRTAAERRARSDAAVQAYAQFLEAVATPAFSAVVSAAKGENLGFELNTPAGGLVFASSRHRGDAIELELDRESDPPVVRVVTTRGRGARVTRSERVLRPDVTIDKIEEDDVIEALLDELRPWLA